MPDIASLAWGLMESLNGLRVRLDASMVERVWVFPVERFVEYEPKDEGWCRRLGFGHEEIRPSKQAVRIGGDIFMHPATWDAIKQHIRIATRRHCPSLGDNHER